MLGSVVAYQSWQYPMCLWVMPVDFRMVIPPWGSLEDTHPDTWHPGLIVIEYQSNKHDAYRLRTLVVYLPDYTRLAQIENRIKAKKPEIIPHNETMDIDPTARRLLSYNLPTSNIFPPKQLTLCQFPKKWSGSIRNQELNSLQSTGSILGRLD